MSKLSPSLTPIVERLEALLHYARRPDLGPGDLDEPLIEAVNEIRAMTVEAVAKERAAATDRAAAFPPSGLPSLPASEDAPHRPQAPARTHTGRPDRL